MIDFFRDLFARPGAARTVILLEPDTMSTPRQYEVRPGYALYAAIIVTVVGAAVLIAAIVLTPLRGWLIGPGAEELRGVAEENAARAAALEDSLTVQYQQIAQLRAIITGDIDELGEAALDPEAFTLPELTGDEGAATPRPAPNDRDAHRQPAFPMRTLSAAPEAGTTSEIDVYLAGLRLPALPPLDGVVSRGYDAARGHFAVDIAADEGTPLRSFPDGYVVGADWTHAGGHTIAVQHTGGYLSVYKHNSRLLKRVGERVRAREVVALSGDSGEITTGPHLHFELWRDGLAQDPDAYFILP